MRFYRSAWIVVLMGVCLGPATGATAQSFNYPPNSKTIFSRWAKNHDHQRVVPQHTSLNPTNEVVQPVSRFTAQNHAPTIDPSNRNSTGLASSMLNKLREFGVSKAFFFNGKNPKQPVLTSSRLDSARSIQTSYTSPNHQDNAGRSILEVVEDPSRNLPSAQTTLSNLNASPSPNVAVQPPSTTQRLVQQQQRVNPVIAPASSKPSKPNLSPSRFQAGSFENEFSQAYQQLGLRPQERVARALPVQPQSDNTAPVNPRFDLIPNGAGIEKAEVEFPFTRRNDIAPPAFESPVLDVPAPNVDPNQSIAPNQSDFSPPNSMIFEAPGGAPPEQSVTLGDLFPAGPPTDLMHDTQSGSDTKVTPQSDHQSEAFTPVDTEEKWTPPKLPQRASISGIPTAQLQHGKTDVTWWTSLVNQPLNQLNQAFPVNTNELVIQALRNSPRIKAVSKTPLIRELQVVEADSEFDTVTFLQSQFQDRVDPVGNSLTTGGAPFLEDNIWSAEAGLRRKLRNGADYQISQRLGFQNSNSTFFTPQDQGTATLALNVTQPLLRGRGEYVNQAQILIAQSTGGAAWDTFKTELQIELEQVVTAYWDLYLQRSIYLQRRRNVERGQQTLARLEGRQGLDSLPAQIARARSAVLTRRTELANAFRDVRNAETEIRRLIADKNWQASQSIELLPAEMPLALSTGLELEQVVYTALENRPEISEAIRRIRVASVQRNVSANELLPQLDLLLGTYVSSLRGDSGILNAFQDQFGQVTPGYSVGIEFELPYRNRAARSRLQQQNLQFKRLQNELESVIQNVIAESQVATRKVSSALETLNAARQAVVASRADLLQNQKRWESFALVEGDLTDGQSPTTVLDQLLDSQERLSQTENVYVQAEQELKVSEVSLQRIMGTLLMHQQVNFSRTVTNDSPSVHITKNMDQTATHQPNHPVQHYDQFGPSTVIHTKASEPVISETGLEWDFPTSTPLQSFGGVN